MKKNKQAAHLMTKLFCIAFVVVGLRAHSQNIPESTPPDSVITKFTQHLLVSREKALQIWSAYHTNQGAIAQLLANRTIPVEQKHQQFLQFIAQRQAKIDSVLTNDQQELMKRKLTTSLAKQQTAREAQHRRHLQQVNKIPHKRVLVSSKTDTIRKHYVIKNQ